VDKNKHVDFNCICYFEDDAALCDGHAEWAAAINVNLPACDDYLLVVMPCLNRKEPKQQASDESGLQASMLCMCGFKWGKSGFKSWQCF
jgi:hypothetical protein